jgi:class 3 adenylate cyclase
LCGEARPSQIVISQRAFGSIETSVEAALLGELSLKGFNRPIPAYEVLRWRPQSPASGGSAATKSGPVAETGQAAPS